MIQNVVKLFHNNYFYIVVLTLLWGFVATFYMPHRTNDIVKYYVLHEDYKELSVQMFFSQVPYDFMLYFLLFIFSKLNISPSYFFFLNTFIAVFPVYWIAWDYYRKKELKISLLAYYCIVTIGLSLISIFSGIRFANGVAWCILAIYTWGYLGNKRVAILFFTISLLVHFSFFIVVLCFLLYTAYKNSFWYVYYLFTILILGILISIDFTDVSTGISYFDGKINYYLVNDVINWDTITNAQYNVKASFVINFLWIVSFIYLLLKFQFYKTNKIMSVLFLFFISFLGFPNLLSRYAMLVVPFVLLQIVYFIDKKKISKTEAVLLIFPFVLNFVVSLWVMRYNFLPE